MDNISFLNALLSPVGLRVLAAFPNGMKQPPVHHYFEDAADLLALAAKYNARGINVYHACATYLTESGRTGDNAGYAKALWMDLDCGPGKAYETQRDAAAAVKALCKTIALPKPWIISSGYGLHVYFVFSAALKRDSWRKLSRLFAAVLDHIGVKHDSSRTTDIASILRTPGTTNYKRDEPQPVLLLVEGSETAPQDIHGTLKAYSAEHFLDVALDSPKPLAPGQTNDLVGTPREYEPADAQRLIAGCPTLQHIDVTGGDCSFALWRAAMGVAKHTTAPDEVAMRWTRHRAETGHDKVDWQREMDSWRTGPATCAEMRKHDGHKCDGCPHSGVLSSPIRLGWQSTPPVEEAVEQTDDDGMALKWAFKSPWVLQQLSSKFGVGVRQGRMYRNVTDDDSNTVKSKFFCDRYWQPTGRIRTVENVWQIEISYEPYPGQPPETFLLDASVLMAAEPMRREFSARELHIYGGQLGMQTAQEIGRWVSNEMRNDLQEVRTYPIMGWASEGHVPRGVMTGEFVIGTTLLAPKQPPKEIMLAADIPDQLRTTFRASGTAEEWSALIDEIYNRRGAEAYQFIICAAFAAPLVRLVPNSGLWHGIPIALTGDSGAAKTSTAMAALTLYGPPNTMLFVANDKGGDTTNALSTKIGMLQNVPFLADEMTSVDAEKLGDTMYMLAHGRMKDRCKPDGTLIPNNKRWDVISFATGNDEFHDKLTQLRNEDQQEATQLRVFEIRLYKRELAQLFGNVTKMRFEHDLLASQYGAAGLKWLQFVVNNREKISDLLGKQRRALKIDPEDPSSMRFYHDLLLTIEVAAELAKSRGFIHFDLDRMMAWARKQMSMLRDGVYVDRSSASTSDFVASLFGRTIVTKRMQLGRGRRHAIEIPLETLSSAHYPIARKAIDDRLFFVTDSALREWAKNNRMTPQALIGRLIDQDLLVVRDGKPKTREISIGSGSTVPRPSAPCWELNYTKAVELAAEIEADEQPPEVPDNVIALRESVTTSVTADEDTELDAGVNP